MGTYKDLNDYEIMYLVEENDDARELLFDKYKPIIKKIASNYKLDAKRIGLELEDLIQEGYVGLYSAIKNYNPDGGALFYTYAVVSIRSKILNYLKTNGSQKHQNLNESISLSNPIFYDDDSLLIDYVIDKNASIPYEVIDENEIINTVRCFLYTLNIDLASIFELSFNGFVNADIGRLLDFPSKLVANHLFRIRKKLNRII